MASHEAPRRLHWPPTRLPQGSTDHPQGSQKVPLGSNKASTRLCCPPTSLSVWSSSIFYTCSFSEVISLNGFDAKLKISFSPSFSYTVVILHRSPVCLADTSSWMAAHHLKLNPTKTTFLHNTYGAFPFQDLVTSLHLTI